MSNVELQSVINRNKKSSLIFVTSNDERFRVHEEGWMVGRKRIEWELEQTSGDEIIERFE